MRPEVSTNCDLPLPISGCRGPVKIDNPARDGGRGIDEGDGPGRELAERLQQKRVMRAGQHDRVGAEAIAFPEAGHDLVGDIGFVDRLAAQEFLRQHRQPPRTDQRHVAALAEIANKRPGIFARHGGLGAEHRDQLRLRRRAGRLDRGHRADERHDESAVANPPAPASKRCCRRPRPDPADASRSACPSPRPRARTIRDSLTGVHRETPRRRRHRRGAHRPQLGTSRDRPSVRRGRNRKPEWWASGRRAIARSISRPLRFMSRPAAARRACARSPAPTARRCGRSSDCPTAHSRSTAEARRIRLDLDVVAIARDSGIGPDVDLGAVRADAGERQGLRPHSHWPESRPPPRARCRKRPLGLVQPIDRDAVLLEIGRALQPARRLARDHAHRA